MREYLALVRVQSTPVTVIAMLLGYATHTGTILDPNAIWLVIVGTLGHWGFYAMNDVFDARFDRQAGRMDKPIVSGGLTRYDAAKATVILSSSSLAVAYITFPSLSFALYTLAAVIGTIYNITNKTNVHSTALMGFWGGLIVGVGWAFGDGSIHHMPPLAVSVGVFMAWTAVMGNFKDMREPERSLPKMLGCKLVNDRVYFSKQMNNLIVLFLLSLTASITAVSFGGDLVLMLYVATISSLGLWITGVEVFDVGVHDPRRIKKNIVKHTVVIVVALLSASLSFMGGLSVITAVVFSIGWGLMWQRVMYGDPFYFP